MNSRMSLFAYDLMLITMILLPIPLSNAFGSYSGNKLCTHTVLCVMSSAFGSFKHLMRIKPNINVLNSFHSLFVYDLMYCVEKPNIDENGDLIIGQFPQFPNINVLC